jgi:phage-related protein
LKPVEFMGVSLARVREFPKGARRAAGYQLDRVQRGLQPDDWKPMQAIGPGVRELRIRDQCVSRDLPSDACRSRGGPARLPEIDAANGDTG